MLISLTHPITVTESHNTYNVLLKVEDNSLFEYSTAILISRRIPYTVFHILDYLPWRRVRILNLTGI